MTTTATDPLEAVLSRLEGVRQAGNNQYESKCPAHTDNHPSLSIGVGEGGRVLLRCQAGCEFNAIVAALGMEPRDLFAADDRQRCNGRQQSNGKRKPGTVHPTLDRATEAAAWSIRQEYGDGWTLAQSYVYRTAQRVEAFRMLRFERNGKKEMRPVRPVDGGFIVKIPTDGRPLYGLPELAAGRVYLIEGERAAHKGREIGLNTTTSAMGSNAPIGKTDWTPLAGREVAILPDADKPGLKYARNAAKALCQLKPPAEVRIVELPGLPAGGDLVEFVLGRGSQATDEIRAEVEAMADEAFAKSTESVEGVETSPPQSPSSRPRIVVNSRPQDTVSDEVSKELVRTNNPPRLLVRAGQLVTIIQNEDGRPFISGVNEHVLRGDIARACHTIRVNQDGDGKHVPPPLEIVRDILHARSWHFPPLVGIVEGPVLRLDGTILDRPGYDAKTRVMYVKPATLTVPAIPDLPMAEDAEHAVEVLDEVLGDFPFEHPADRANALAGLLTPVVRLYINGHCPLLVLDAPQAGAGKGLIASVICMIATGRPAALMQAPGSDEEWTKKITTVLIEGATTIIIDNIERPLRSPALASALTADEWSDRLLGVNKSICVQQRAAWIGTGNNVRLGGDMPRRCYRSRIDPGLARPWERQGFRHPDLLGYVAEHRGGLLAALLTMARAWIVAGKPVASVKPIGSFERWTRVVGGVLQYAGVEGFLANLDTMYDQADDEGPAWEAFLRAWANTFAANPATVADVTTELERDAPNDLRDALPDWLLDPFVKGNKSAKSFRVMLGRALQARDGKRFGKEGYHLKRAGSTRSGAIKWIVKIKEVAGA